MHTAPIDAAQLALIRQVLSVRRWSRRIRSCVMGCCLGLAVSATATATAVLAESETATKSKWLLAETTQRRVQAPVTPLVVVGTFEPPASRWGAGHRGIDLMTQPGQQVHAVAEGTVIYAGVLVDRPVISIRHGFLRTTYEPVEPTVKKGQRVMPGQVIGAISGNHASCRGSCLHLGAIAKETYVNPLWLLTRHWQAVLRPVYRNS